MNIYSLPGAENWQRMKDVHHAHLKASLSEVDFVISELYELAEYLNDPNEHHETRHKEIIAEALEYMHGIKDDNHG